MKKLTLILAVVALAGILLAYPAMAFTPPSQGTDNATDTIIWHGDNLTLDALTGTFTLYGQLSNALTGTLTITALETAIDSGAQVIADEIDIIWDGLLLFLLVSAITALAFWQKNVFLYLIAVPVNMVYGLSLAAGSTAGSNQWVIGVIIAIIGLFCLFKVVAGELLRRKEK